MTSCPIPTREPYLPHVAAKRLADDVYQCGWNDALAEAVGHDRTSCAYYMRRFGGDPKGICSFGYQEEPECVTCEPTNGWPEANRIASAVAVAVASRPPTKDGNKTTMDLADRLGASVVRPTSHSDFALPPDRWEPCPASGATTDDHGLTPCTDCPAWVQALPTQDGGRFIDHSREAET